MDLNATMESTLYTALRVSLGEENWLDHFVMASNYELHVCVSSMSIEQLFHSIVFASQCLHLDHLA